MTEPPARPTFHGFEQIPLEDFAERSYLDYSMYVVLDRALPFIGDRTRIGTASVTVQPHVTQVACRHLSRARP